MKFQENPSDLNHTVLCGQTDRHDEAPLCKPTSQTTQNQLYYTIITSQYESLTFCKDVIFRVMA